jgi:septum formation protein
MTLPQARLILASASPRRRELLDQIGVAYQVQVADIPECPEPGETPEAYVHRVAADKSLAVWQASGGISPVLAADTEVVLDGAILGKPRDQSHAAALLASLADREHRVLSAVSLRAGTEHWQALSASTVAFRAISPEAIAAYWASGEPRDKAGAYAIQGLGAVFVRHLSGSYSGVMGLPLFETAQLLARIGLGPLVPHTV